MSALRRRTLSIRDTLALGAAAAALLVSALFGLVSYRNHSAALLQGADAKLLTAAQLEGHLPPKGYFDSITDATSVSPAVYLQIVQTNNHLCRELGLQYLWSVMLLDGRVVFTTATSPGLDASAGDHAGFLEEHRDPDSFAEAFASMQPVFSSFHNEWGHGRMVLVPGLDARGRRYCLGASMSMAEVGALRRSALWQTLGVSALVLALFLLVSVPLAGTLARPLREVAEAAERISAGDLQQRVVVSRTTELVSLGDSINTMSDNIQRTIGELREHRDHLAELVAARTAELERSNADLQQFAYLASHDLQEPLRMVRSFGQLLQRTRTEQLDAEGQEFLGFMVDGAERMQQLIDALLAYSRVDTRGGDFDSCDCQAALQRALHHLALAIEESQAEIHCDGLPELLADQAQITQVFQNLVGNALKFRGPAPPVITVSAEQDAAGWTFCVQDGGIGIPAEQRERIFGMFQRLHGRSDYPGQGIGLAFCRRIVERHGGRIWVEPAPGQGSRFYFMLPAEGHG